MLGFKSFWSAQKLISGIETMHMIKKGQMDCPDHWQHPYVSKFRGGRHYDP